jgi:hypothetical protein
MCLLSCFTASAAAGAKVKKGVDKVAGVFESKKPVEPVEPGFITELKLNYKVSTQNVRLGSRCAVQYWGVRADPPPPPSFLLQLTSGKAGSADQAPSQQLAPSRSISRSVSKKEAASKARLQELIDKHAPSRTGR